MFKKILYVILVIIISLSVFFLSAINSQSTHINKILDEAINTNDPVKIMEVLDYDNVFSAESYYTIDDDSTHVTLSTFGAVVGDYVEQEDGKVKQEAEKGYFFLLRNLTQSDYQPAKDADNQAALVFEGSKGTLTVDFVKTYSDDEKTKGYADYNLFSSALDSDGNIVSKSPVYVTVSYEEIASIGGSITNIKMLNGIGETVFNKPVTNLDFSQTKFMALLDEYLEIIAKNPDATSSDFATAKQAWLDKAETLDYAHVGISSDVLMSSSIFIAPAFWALGTIIVLGVLGYFWLWRRRNLRPSGASYLRKNAQTHQKSYTKNVSQENVNASTIKEVIDVKAEEHETSNNEEVTSQTKTLEENVEQDNSTTVEEKPEDNK